jgi:Flp pilus assembly pilin Flp
MLKLYLTLQNLWADKRGVTAIEYAVLAGAVAVALAVLANGGSFDTLAERITGAIESVDDPTASSTTGG